MDVGLDAALEVYLVADVLEVGDGEVQACCHGCFFFYFSTNFYFIKNVFRRNLQPLAFKIQVVQVEVSRLVLLVFIMSVITLVSAIFVLL